MVAHGPDPAHLARLRNVLGDTSRAATDVGESLLESFPVLGDHATQSAVDDLVDELCGLLREVSLVAQETSLGVAGALRRAEGRRGGSGRGTGSTIPADHAAPGRP